MSKKAALGKGIDALFGGEPEPAAVEANSPVSQPVFPAESSEEETVRLVPIEIVSPNGDQPRKSFDDDTLTELADSIREKGVLQPILVEVDGDHYRIIAGERRYRASIIAGLKKIPLIVRELSEEDRLEVALIENIQREDLNALEEALAYKSIMDSGKLSQEQVAKKVGKKRSTVANSLRLLRLDKDMQRSLAEGQLTSGHARSILSLENPADQRILHSRILHGEVSVREAERMASELSKGKRVTSSKKEPPLRAPITPELQHIEQKFINTFGTKVRIKGSNHKGTIEIAYLSMEDLERILDIIE